MKKRLIIIVCIVILFIENLPEGIITSAIEKSIVGKNEKICSNYNNKIINNYDENIKGESPEISIQNNEEELGLDKVKFSAYINKTNDLLFSIGFNILEKKFTVENQLDKNISEETPEEVMYKIRLYDKEGKEKLAIELNGSDTGNSKKLEPLKNLSYEIGDFVQIIPVNKKDVLKITGNIQGDITKEKEDYLDGIDNYDYIENVRFEIADDHLNSIYNEAPVISGLNDIIDSENPNNDIFTGISVKDDHDGIIDNSKLEVEVIQLQDGILEVRYIAIDSWGRKTIGSRRIFPKSISKLIDEPENQEEQIISDKELPTPNNVNIENASDQLTQNEIIVEGTPYYDTEVRRFRLRFDTIANQIQIMDEDGRQMSNSINGEYFKFVLYDKDMNKIESSTKFTASSKDLMMASRIKEMIDIGITSLKVEGRMRSNYYVATVINTYRGIIDDYYNNKLSDEKLEHYIRILDRVANREATVQFWDKLPGVNEQYYLGRNEVSNQDFLGIVTDYDEENKIVTITERNYFKTGDVVEVFGPNIETFSFIVPDIYDNEGNKVNVGRHPEEILRFKLDKKVYKDDMIRIKID